MRHSFTTLSGGGRHHLGLEDSAAEDEVPAEEVAGHLGTIVNELVCFYSKKRLPRLYKGEW